MTVVRILLVLSFISSAAQASQPEIHYVLSMPHPQSHLFEVSIQLRDIVPDTAIDLTLPSWRPGRYVILDFAGGVQEFSAEADGAPLPWHKTDKSTWHIKIKGVTSISVNYKVYANEFEQRTRGLNDQHAFVDGTSVFMYAERYRHLPISLSVKPYGRWHTTTGLASKGVNTFTAPDYDYFIDCPLEIGNQKDFQFKVDGIPHVLSIFGEGNWNADTLIRDISKIVRTEKEFWGVYPYERYVFLLECLPNGGGGTEHINSTIMQTYPFGFKNPGSYRGVLGLVAHEFFHTWNVKQLRPKGLKPYDFHRENYSEELWVAEGMTSYYDELLMVRAGFTPVSEYLERIGSAIAADRNRPGNTLQSVASSSFEAWIEYWRGMQQSYNAESDYYELGSMVSCILDLSLRRLTSGRHSLDDVMREMYRRFPLSGPGYTLADLRTVAGEVGGAEMANVFDEDVYGAKPLRWEEALSAAGLEVSGADSIARPYTGIYLNDGGGSTRITRIVAGSPAYLSGLDIGDELLALNGFRVRAGSFADRIGEMKPGDPITLTVFQREQLRTVQLTLGIAPQSSYRVEPVKTPTEAQRAVFQSWTGMQLPDKK